MILILTLSSSVVCLSHNLDEFSIENIEMPPSFEWCDREKASPKFSNMLKNAGFTHERWLNEIMLPQSIYLCGQDGYGNQINIVVKDPDKDENESIQTHKYIYDYNILSGSAKETEKILVTYREVLSDGGIDPKDIVRIRWYEPDQECVTPFVMGIYKDGANYICQYRTVYAGNNFNFSYVAKAPISDELVAELDGYISQIVFSEEIDYSHAEQVYRQNKKVKIPTGSKSFQKNTDQLIIASGIFIVSVLIFSIYETTNKSRKRNRSRKSSKYGKY